MPPGMVVPIKDLLYFECRQPPSKRWKRRSTLEGHVGERSVLPPMLSEQDSQRSPGPVNWITHTAQLGIVWKDSPCNTLKALQQQMGIGSHPIPILCI